MKVGSIHCDGLFLWTLEGTHYSHIDKTIQASLHSPWTVPTAHLGCLHRAIKPGKNKGVVSLLRIL